MSKLSERIKSEIAGRVVTWSMKNWERGERGDEVINTENARNVYNLYTTEFAQLTSANVKFYLEAKRRGLGWFAYVLFKEIKRRDLHIGGVCQTRKLSVCGKHDLTNAGEYIECEDEAMKEFVIDALKGCDIVGFSADCTDSSLEGVANFEINWAAKEGKVIIEKIKRIPNELLYYDDTQDKYYFLAKDSMDVFKLRTAATVLGEEDRVSLKDLSVVEVPKEKLLEVHSLDGDSPNGMLNGCVDGLVWAHLFKGYVLKDLHVFIELFAIPAIIGKYDPLMSKEDKKKFSDAIKNFGNHFRMTVPKDADVSFVTDGNKGTAADIFHQTLGYWDNKISIRVLGQTLTTELGKNGSFAAAKTHNTVREDLLRADITVFQRAMNELIKKVCDMNFDMTNKEYPRFALPESLSIEDKKTLVDVYKATQELGYKISKEKIETEIETGGLEERSEPKKEPDKGFVKKFVTFIERMSSGARVTDEETAEFLNGIFNEII